MNEIIRELYVKATHCPSSQSEESTMNNFANLLIDHCITICGAIRDANRKHGHHIFADGADRCATIIERDLKDTE